MLWLFFRVVFHVILVHIIYEWEGVGDDALDCSLC